MLFFWKLSSLKYFSKSIEKKRMNIVTRIKISILSENYYHQREDGYFIFSG
jgi:hypothetical protein